MINNENVSPVTPDHALAFGFIINFFAKCELHMQIAAAGILNADLATAVILMGDMHYRQKQQTLRHLNATIGINGEPSETLTSILDDLHKHQTIRNAVAHSVWTTGRKPGAIKPMQLLLRAKEPRPLGHHHNEENYTVSRLLDIVKSLDCIDARFRDFLDSSGLSTRAEARMEDTNSTNGPSPG